MGTATVHRITIIYLYASPNCAAGVFIAVSIGLVTTRLNRDITAPMIMLMISECATALFTLLSFLAPNSLAMIMPKPPESPLAKVIIRLKSDDVAPIATSALSPKM